MASRESQTLVRAWNPLSVNCEQPAASSVLHVHKTHVPHHNSMPHKHIEHVENGNRQNILLQHNEIKSTYGGNKQLIQITNFKLLN